MFSDILSGEVGALICVELFHFANTDGQAMNAASHKYGERQLLYCIPVPAENSWVTGKVPVVHAQR